MASPVLMSTFTIVAIFALCAAVARSATAPNLATTTQDTSQQLFQDACNPLSEEATRFTYVSMLCSEEDVRPFLASHYSRVSAQLQSSLSTVADQADSEPETHVILLFSPSRELAQQLTAMRVRAHVRSRTLQRRTLAPSPAPSNCSNYEQIQANLIPLLVTIPFPTEPERIVFVHPHVLFPASSDAGPRPSLADRVKQRQCEPLLADVDEGILFRRRVLVPDPAIMIIDWKTVSDVRRSCADCSWSLAHDDGVAADGTKAASTTSPLLTRWRQAMLQPPQSFERQFTNLVSAPLSDTPLTASPNQAESESADLPFSFQLVLPPWTFFNQSHKLWKSPAYMTVMHRWLVADRQASAWLDAAGVPVPWAAKWANGQRWEELCSAHVYTLPADAVYDKTTVAISTYSPAREKLMLELVQHYAAAPVVAEVVVTWHDPRPASLERMAKVIESIKALKLSKPVRILQQTADSLNNRFNPIPDIRTRSVYICDDDVKVAHERLAVAVELWNDHQDVILGYFPRSFRKTKKGDSIRYVINDSVYSMVLTKAMLMDARMLALYTCASPSAMLALIDVGTNCEDIAVNYLVSSLTDAPHLSMNGEPEDFGVYDSTALMARLAHGHVRSTCMNDLARVFGRNPLKPRAYAVVAFTGQDYIMKQHESIKYKSKDTPTPKAVSKDNKSATQVKQK